MSEKGNVTYRLIEHIFGENRDMLERLAYFYVGSREDAQDIVSQSFMHLWEKRAELLEDRILPYLFTTVKNACLDFRRKASIHKQTHDQLQRQERSMMEIYTSTIESEVWLRNRIDGLTYKEIATALGITYKRVDKDMQKVMKKLKAALSEYLSLFLILSSMGMQL